MKYSKQKLFKHFLPYFLFLIIGVMNCCSKDNSKPPQADVDPVDENELPLNELLEKVQKRTFKYFWDFAEPTSGMAKERSQTNAFGGESHRIVSTAGTGFGLASFPVAVERGWITRADAITRINKILTFLESADKYHGAFSHWYYGDTGKTKPFSKLDDGGDIVETSFLIEGLLINRQYFSGSGNDEKNIRNRITAIWKNVDWTWYTNGQKHLIWHWSPTHNFSINLKVEGWNEALITYVLAAASPTHHIDRNTYENGWARNGSFRNGHTYYNYVLPVGPVKGGPLFFAHYSFIGLDPRNLSDQYVTNYFDQNKNHTLINYEYCKDNPHHYAGYGENSWGLTASDNNNGYAVHSPTNDLGIITPTAALSSFPYTPTESEKALRYFYKKRNKLWGKYGFYDAFSEQHNWYSDGFLAIDQGPIVAMIENYRTQQLWNLFMADNDVKNGLRLLGFTSPHLN